MLSYEVGMYDRIMNKVVRDAENGVIPEHVMEGFKEVLIERLSEYNLDDLLLRKQLELVDWDYYKQVVKPLAFKHLGWEELAES